MYRVELFWHQCSSISIHSCYVVKIRCISQQILISSCHDIMLINYFVGVIPYSGVAVTFLFGFLLLIFSAVVFFFGANAQKICQALDGPEYPLFSEVTDG